MCARNDSAREVFGVSEFVKFHLVKSGNRQEVTRKNNVVQRGKLNNDINFILILESKMKSKFSKLSQWLVANKLSSNIDKTN